MLTPSTAELVADALPADFNMTYLALNFSSFCNGVSQLHGVASRELLHPYWPSQQKPIDYQD